MAAGEESRGQGWPGHWPRVGGARESCPGCQTQCLQRILRKAPREDRAVAVWRTPSQTCVSRKSSQQNRI